MRCNCLKNCRTIRYIFRYRSDLIKRRAVCDKSISGNSSISWFQSDNPTERTRLTDGSAGIRSKCIITFGCCHCRTGTTGRTSRNMRCVVRIACRSVIRCLCCTSHGKFIHVRLTNDNRSCFSEVLNCLSRIGRFEVGKNLGTACGKLSFDTHIILYCNRNSCKRTCQFARIYFLLNFLCLCISTFFIYRHKAVNL